MESQIPAKLHESVKEDLAIELKEAETAVRSYREFITWVAKEIGCNQETELIRARIVTLVSEETKLKNIQDNRPLTKNPFDGVGNLMRKLLSLMIDKFLDR